eukprot:scaffold228591_cov32-Tisochrysis_lutea.AAC.4
MSESQHQTRNGHSVGGRSAKKYFQEHVLVTPSAIAAEFSSHLAEERHGRPWARKHALEDVNREGRHVFIRGNNGAIAHFEALQCVE